MAKYSTFLYGDGTFYGYTSVIDAILPSSGSAKGGESFVIKGSAFNNTSYDDTFSEALLDLLKWSSLASGTGTITTNSPYLKMSTGATSSSVAGVESVGTFSDFQWEIKTVFPSVSAYPVSSVKVIGVSAYIDSSNYAELSVNLTSSGFTIDASVVVGGSTVDSYSDTWSSGTSVLKVLRWKGDVYFYGNGVLLFKSTRFIDTAMNLRIYNSNNSASYNVFNTVVEYAKLLPYVAFGDQIQNTIVVAGNRVRGMTPPSIDVRGQEAAYKGLVDVSVVTSDTTTRSNFFEYYYDKSLTLVDSSQFNVKISIIDNDIVRTPDGVSIGLGSR